MVLYNSTDISITMTSIINFFSATYLIFASTMYFNLSPIRLDSNQTNISTLYLTWKL